MVDWGMGAGFGLVAFIFALLWIAIVVGILVLIVLGIRWLLRQDRGSSSAPGPSGPPSATPRPDDPLEILRQRYARGEIDEEEYERRKRVLGG